MQSAIEAPVLADTANVLSDQLLAHLQRLAVLVRPHAATLEKNFLSRLRRLRYGPAQRVALAALTPGAAARILARGRPPADFLEQVEYNGRRLAKLNLAPVEIQEALAEYDCLLTPLLCRLIPGEHENFQWVREQLQFCVILTLNRAYYQVRETEARAFYELFRAEMEARNLDQLLQGCLEVLARFCRAHAAHLFVVDEEKSAWILKASVKGDDSPISPLLAAAGRTLRRRQLSRPRWIHNGSRSELCLLDASWLDRYPSFWSVPLISEDQVVGVMQFGFSKHYEWLPRERELLEAAAERCIVAAEKARLVEDLAAHRDQIRQLAEDMLHIEEIERRRISRELHDEAGQSMLCIRLQLEMLENSIPADQTKWITRLTELRRITERTILEVRRLIAALSPAVLEQLGLAAALRQLVSRFRQLYPCRVRLHLPHLGDLPKRMETIAYRIVQECCNNIAKHSSASNVNISLSCADGILRLYVEDDGVGFRVEEGLAKRDSFGITGMRERVALLGGSFDIRSVKGGKRKTRAKSKHRSGTRIAVQLPIPKQPATAPK